METGPEKRSSPGRTIREGLIGLLRFAWRGCAGFRIGRRGGGAGRDGFRCFGAVTHQVRHEGGDFKRHLLTFRHRAHRLALDELQLIVPGIHLYASADRQRRDHLRVLLLIDRRRGLEISHDRHDTADRIAMARAIRDRRLDRDDPAVPGHTQSTARTGLPVRAEL